MDRIISKKGFWHTYKKNLLLFGLPLFLISVAIIYILNTTGIPHINKSRVFISEVKYEPFREYISVNGNVIPEKSVVLDVPNGGRIMKSCVSEGEYLSAGDTIIALDNPQLRLNIMYNEANVFQALNNLRSTKLSMQQNRLSLMAQLLRIDRDIFLQKKEYNINSELYKKNLISELDFARVEEDYNYLLRHRELTLETFEQDSLMRQSQINQLERSVETLQSNLEITKKQLDGLTIRAPISGQLTSYKVNAGEVISAGENIGFIDDIYSFRLLAKVDEFYLNSVHTGDSAICQIADDKYMLSITKVIPLVQENMFDVELNFSDKRPESLIKGQTITIQIILGNLEEKLVLEKGNFYNTSGGKWVFKLTPDGNGALRLPVQIGRQNDQYFEIIEGLNAGDKVIISGYELYRNSDNLILN